jgi:hypothetical protein
MNPTDPNEIPELVTLHLILKDNGCTVKLPDAPTQHGYIFRFSHNKRKPGIAFEQAAEKLVPEQGGKVSSLRSMSGGGFSAFFSTEDDRLKFLKAFSDAASALYTPPVPTKITRTENGIKLGV